MAKLTEKQVELILMLVSMGLTTVLRLVEQAISKSIELTPEQLEDLLIQARESQLKLDDTIESMVNGG